ncbi:hypothetical protein [Streptomyces zhihengii]
MAIQQHTLYVAHCDVCRKAFDEDSDMSWGWDETPELALAQVAENPDWTVNGQTVVCPVSDAAHDQARGGPSPVELRPTGDAMAVTYSSAA